MIGRDEHEGGPATASPTAAAAAGARAARVLAYYLPQFHPIPENDRWWGPGFTEWTNVTRARPRFPGHVQPRRPGSLGYYDLRDPEIRARQAELARAAGVEGFCYWHYWFGGGQRLLERPFAEVVASGEPDLPFCIGWANQSWTGIWHGEPGRVLMEQRYPGPDDDEAHFREVLPALADPRYVRVDGAAVIALQDVRDLPSAPAFTDGWRALAEREGVGPLWFVADDPGDGALPADHGFDRWTRPVSPLFPHRIPLTGADRIRRAAIRRAFGVRVAPYARFVDAYPGPPLAAHELPQLVPGWDNTPRSGRNGTVFTGFAPETFRRHARVVVASVADRPAEERVVFLKSWNEWAEGNYVEPDAAYGSAVLDAIAEELAHG